MQDLPDQAEVDRLEGEIAEVCGVVNAASGRLVELIASVMEIGAWNQGGIRSVEHWVAWKCGISSGRARGLVKIASRLGELPVTGAAFCAGELSVDQVGLIARHVPAHVDAEVCELARHATVEQLQRTLPRYVFAQPLDQTQPSEARSSGPEPAGCEPAGCGPAGEARPQPVPVPEPEPEYIRRVAFGHDDDGSWWMSARLDPDEGALVERALAAAREELFSGEHPQDTRPAPGQVSWADALVGLADRSLSPGAGLRAGRDRHLMLIHLRADSAAYLHLGPALPDSLRRQLGCDGRIRAAFEAQGVVLSVGRTQRIVPERTRMAIEDRDGGCRVPGCLRRRWLQVHHLTHWEDGGPTDTPNLLAMCSHHHRLHHRGRLGIAGNADRPDGVTFTDERGRTIAPCGLPVPPGSVRAGVSCLDLAVSQWAHPSGERLDHWAVHFNEGLG